MEKKIERTIEETIITLLREHSSSGGLSEDQLFNYTVYQSGQRGMPASFFGYTDAWEKVKGRTECREVKYTGYDGSVKNETRLFLRE